MVYSDTRLAFYDRDFASGPAECANNFPAGAGNDCQTHYKAGDYAGAIINYGGGNPGYEQETWGAQNITGFLAKLNAGGLKQEIVAGIDTYYQSNERDTWLVNGNKQPTSGPNRATLLNPVFENVTGYYLSHDANANNGRREADATSFAVFASDRVWLTKEFSFLGGVRWDDYNANYGFRCNTTDSATTPQNDACNEWRETESSTQFWSPKLSLIWEPSEQETYYVSWARSFTPAGTFISNEVNAIGILPGQSALDPEVSETWEAGAKYNLLNNKLGLTAAVFQITKDNASYTDSQGDSVPSGEVQRVRGFELGVSGQVTRAWFLQSSYAYLDSEILDGKTLRSCTGVVIAASNTASCPGIPLGTYVSPVYDPTNTGNKIQQAPENAFNIWTTYNLSTLFYTGPGKLTAGGGVTYVDRYFTTSANNNIIPYQLTFDGLIQYEVDHWKFALNGYNLTDELYYTEAFSNRATPAPGRTVLFTAGTKF
jgi:catecholate siderophore receptor